MCIVYSHFLASHTCILIHQCETLLSPSSSSINNTTNIIAVPSAKCIGMLGSVAIAVNSLAGPAILQLPFTFQHSGLIPTTLGLLVVGFLSSLVCLHMAHVVSQIPSNCNFTMPIEFSDPFRVFWNESAYNMTLLLYYMCVLCINVAAMVDVSQIVDSILGHCSPFGTYGLAVFPELHLHHWQRGPCSRAEVKLGQCVPFQNNGDCILTLGYVIAASVFIPMCLMDLKENTIGQIVGFIIMCSVVLIFSSSFLDYDLKWKHVPLWGDPSLGISAAWGTMVGVVLFNYALVLAIPAWLHEKKPNVSVPRVIYGSTVFATVMYVGVGLLGALAIPNVNDNMLDPMVSGAFGRLLQVTAGVFGFWNIGLDIPLFSVLARYNFTESGLFPSTRMANVFVVYLPWAVAWMFYQGTLIGILLEWGGILFTSAVAFVLPLYLALRALEQETDDEHEERCTVPVYGRWITSRRAKIISLYGLLALAGVSIVGAIYGQTSTKPYEKSLLDDPDYVNATIAKIRMEALAAKSHRRRHHNSGTTKQ